MEDKHLHFECVDDKMADVLRQKTERERLEPLACGDSPGGWSNKSSDTSILIGRTSKSGDRSLTGCRMEPSDLLQKIVGFF